jgi:hypothetical protein
MADDVQGGDEGVEEHDLDEIDQVEEEEHERMDMDEIDQQEGEDFGDGGYEEDEANSEEAQVDADVDAGNSGLINTAFGIDLKTPASERKFNSRGTPHKLSKMGTERIRRLRDDGNTRMARHDALVIDIGQEKKKRKREHDETADTRKGKIMKLADETFGADGRQKANKGNATKKAAYLAYHKRKVEGARAAAVDEDHAVSAKAEGRILGRRRNVNETVKALVGELKRREERKNVGNRYTAWTSMDEIGRAHV